LNPRPHPYHGCALPTELSRHICNCNLCTIISVGRALRSKWYYSLCISDSNWAIAALDRF